MVSMLEPEVRASSQLPAVRERDRAPTVVRFRGMGLNDREFFAATSVPSRYYRVRVTDRHPLFLAGGVVLGMGLPHLVIGLMTGLDPVGSAAAGRAITDQAGGATMLALAGLHVAVGAILMAVGDRRPNVEPAERALVQQYVDGSAPLLGVVPSGPRPPRHDPNDPTDPANQPDPNDPSYPAEGSAPAP